MAQRLVYGSSVSKSTLSTDDRIASVLFKVKPFFQLSSSSVADCLTFAKRSVDRARLLHVHGHLLHLTWPFELDLVDGKACRIIPDLLLKFLVPSGVGCMLYKDLWFLTLLISRMMHNGGAGDGGGRSHL